jgi:hypothetical protein
VRSICDETSRESAHKPSDRTRRHSRAGCWRNIAIALKIRANKRRKLALTPGYNSYEGLPNWLGRDRLLYDSGTLLLLAAQAYVDAGRSRRRSPPRFVPSNEEAGSDQRSSTGLSAYQLPTFELAGILN